MKIKESFRVGSLVKSIILIMNLCIKIFGFFNEELYHPSIDFNMHDFWSEITRDHRFSERESMSSRLIRNHSYLLMHKLMFHFIFGTQDNTKVSHNELFILWCLYINTRVSSTYFVFQRMWCVV